MSSASNNTTQVALTGIRLEIAALESRLNGEDPQKIVTRHIKLLQDYNEAKDKAQVIIGRLATLKGISIRQLHEDYGLLPED